MHVAELVYRWYTHSHLEHTETQDNDLRVRRDTLALADEAANTAHTQHPRRLWWHA